MAMATIAATAISGISLRAPVLLLAVHGLIPGAALGIAQWLYLRSAMVSVFWPLLTAVTYPIFAFVLVISYLIVANFAEIETAAQVRMALVFTPLAAANLALFCLPMAVVQWLLLGKRFAQAGWWIPATYTGWALAFLGLCLAVAVVARLVDRIDITKPAAALIEGLVLGSIQATVSGGVLVRLKRRPEPQPSPV
jgi:hypothetical protein